MRIIYFTTAVYIGDGTSAAVFSRARRDKGVFEDYLIVANYIGSVDESLNIVHIGERKRIEDFVSKGNVILHYFKARNSNILYEMLKIVGKTTPLLTTVCQNPSYPDLWLTPFEIHNTWHFVFIDKTSYNNHVIKFIPKRLKSQIYLCGDNRMPVFKPDNHGDTIIFGRGSSAMKCPKNMFEVFDKIDVPNKLFRIVGVESEDSWIKKEAEKRADVEVYGHLPNDEWKRMCNTFDVFLYQLPNLCHASVDGTLQVAMLLGKPVVYMGCDAPKERFQHGKNGFVATTVDEMAHYATLLGRNKALRSQIGEAGRVSTVKNFNGEETDEKYRIVYARLKNHERIWIPPIYYGKFFRGNIALSELYLSECSPFFRKVCHIILKFLRFQ